MLAVLGGLLLAPRVLAQPSVANLQIGAPPDVRTPTGGRFSRTRNGALELRTDETYVLPLLVGTDGQRLCGKGSNP